jgi:hypothetical protein
MVLEVKADKSKSAVKPTNAYIPNNANRSAVFKRLIGVSQPELIRIVIGISALIVNSLTNLSFPW